MSLELFRDDYVKNYAKSIRSLRKIVKNHPYTPVLEILVTEIRNFSLFELVMKGKAIM